MSGFGGRLGLYGTLSPPIDNAASSKDACITNRRIQTAFHFDWIVMNHNRAIKIRRVCIISY